MHSTCLCNSKTSPQVTTRSRAGIAEHKQFGSVKCAAVRESPSVTGTATDAGVPAPAPQSPCRGLSVPLLACLQLVDDAQGVVRPLPSTATWRTTRTL